MHKLFVVAVMALALAGCETARQDRVLGGALIGAAPAPWSEVWPPARPVVPSQAE